MRQTLAAICATLGILVILVAGLCTTATPTPTPPPSDTPPTTFTPTTTISGRTFTTYTVPAGTHDVLYEDCTFTGGSADVARGGVLTINRPCYNIVFRNCTIESGPGTGIKIVDAGGTVHDIRFEGCLIKSQPCMGFECIGRPPSGATTGYDNIDLIDCTFEPQGSEAVSYDCSLGLGGHSLIDGVLIKGSGTRPDLFPWGQGLEINNAHYMTVRNTTIYRTRGNTLNLDTTHTTFTDCTFNMSVSYLGSVVRSDYTAIVGAEELRNCTFTNCYLNAGSQGRNSCLGRLENATNNDFRTCTTTGADSSHNKWVEYSGCSGNRYPPGALVQ